MRQPAAVRALAALGVAACASARAPALRPGFAPSGSFGEQTRALLLEPGITATIVAPLRLDPRRRVELVLYALSNGNTTAQTIGRRLAEGVDWHHDIQHIGAQTRALRARGVAQAVVVYLEADRRSWPEWRRRQGYERANARIVAVVDTLRRVLGDPRQVAVTLAAHSGGGSFIFGFLEGQPAPPPWLERIAFLDANYAYERRHQATLARWLHADPRHTLVVLAYDDRDIVLDGKRVVSDSGGTWRASQRMLADLAAELAPAPDTLGDFLRRHGPQVEILLHPNPANRILHTELVGEMNGYLHALLVRRPGHDARDGVLRPGRAYEPWIEPGAPR